MNSKVIDPEQQALLAEYAKAAHDFSQSVDRLLEQALHTERFIEALDVSGTAHRACERIRLKLKKYLETHAQHACTPRGK